MLGAGAEPNVLRDLSMATTDDICTISDPINTAAAQHCSLGSDAHRISRPGRSTPNEPPQIEMGLTLRYTSMSASTVRRFRPTEICAEAKAGLGVDAEQISRSRHGSRPENRSSHGPAGAVRSKDGEIGDEK
jgi:hypothetical protein